MNEQFSRGRAPALSQFPPAFDLRQGAFGDTRRFPQVIQLRVSFSATSRARGTTGSLPIVLQDTWEDRVLGALWLCGIATTAVAFVAAWP